ncbi:DUF2891 family protein [bacterium]|nr:DUF2891 family protein [bacterium]
MHTDGRDWDWSNACQAAGTTEAAVVARCVEMARQGIRREFPCQLPLMMSAAVDFHRPRDVTPVFYGCYDWHSAVHSHWLLIRAARLFPQAGWQLEVLQLLEEQFCPDALVREATFLSAPERVGFERPYGLSWLLQLIAELREWDAEPARRWLQRFEALEAIVVSRMRSWLEKLSGPIRTGEHSQSAFAMGLVADYARSAGHELLWSLVQDVAIRCYGRDCQLPLHLEPSAYDFLSPALATADLLRRFLSAEEMTDWLTQAFPNFQWAEPLLKPVEVVDPRDGKLAHFAGLNFSRCWMAAGMSQALPMDHPGRSVLEQTAIAHFEAGIPMLSSDEYAITHWVGSFALYAVTNRGLC